MKILIVDDSEIISQRLQKFISKSVDCDSDTVAVINNLDNLLMDIYHETPDILILNTYSLRGTLVESIRAINTIRPQTAIICLTEFHDNTFEKILHDAGAAYIIDIVSGIEKVPEIIRELKEKRFNYQRN